MFQEEEDKILFCYNKCKNNLYCTHFNYNVTSNKCIYKYQRGIKQNKSTIQILNNIDFTVEANHMNPFSNSTSTESCKTNCDKEEKCQSSSHNSNYKIMIPTNKIEKKCNIDEINNNENLKNIVNDHIRSKLEANKYSVEKINIGNVTSAQKIDNNKFINNIKLPHCLYNNRIQTISSTQDNIQRWTVQIIMKSCDLIVKKCKEKCDNNIFCENTNITTR